MQDIPTEFNRTNTKKLIELVLDSTLQLTPKKLCVSSFDVVSNKKYHKDYWEKKQFLKKKLRSYRT